LLVQLSATASDRTGAGNGGIALQSLARRHPLLFFFALAFAISWSVAALGWAALELELWQPRTGHAAGHLQGEALAREVQRSGASASLRPITYVVMYVGFWAPSLAGFITVGLIEGGAGVKRLAGKLLRWRVGARWWAAALLLPPGLYVASILLVQTFEQGVLASLQLPSLKVALLFLVAGLLSSPMGEEFGWRGFALPRLTEQMSGSAASLTVGVVWALWHLPAFLPALDRFILPPGLGYLPFSLLIVAAAVLAGWIYLHSGGSVLLAVLFHFTTNTVLLAVGRDPRASLVWLAAGLYVAAALTAAVCDRRYGRRTAVTAQAHQRS
jgi:membrane protease YdiL (CAAX protease family)